MAYQVAIRRIADGETRLYDETAVEWNDVSQFWWSRDGNMGCGHYGCNLHEAFENAAGIEPEFEETGYCSSPNLFEVVYFVVEGKRVEPEPR
jgi:hypothetical protein